MRSTNKFLLLAMGTLAWLSAQAAAEITEKTRKQGMEGAPALVAAAELPCTIADANKVTARGAQVDAYEVSCQQGLGYMVMAGQNKQKPAFYLCIEALDAAPASGHAMMQCELPGNLPEAQRPAIAALVGKTTMSCDLDRWRGIGHTSNKTVIEVACKNGNDQLLMAPYPLTDGTVQSVPCLSLAAGGSISCNLIDRATQLAAIDALFTSESGHACEISDRRYMVTTTTGDNYYEVLCKSGAGYVMQKKPDGKLGSTIECSAKLASDLGGCKLGKPGP